MKIFLLVILFFCSCTTVRVKHPHIVKHNLSEKIKDTPKQKYKILKPIIIQPKIIKPTIKNGKVIYN